MTDDNAEKRTSISRHVDGISLNIGIGLGCAVLHPSAEIKLVPDQRTAENNAQEKELLRLDKAFARLNDEIQALVFQQSPPPSDAVSRKFPIRLGIDSQDILDVYLLLANDPGWKRQLRENIENGMSALWAIDCALQSLRENLEKKTFWQSRISDFEDLSVRLKHYLTNAVKTPKTESGDFPIIVVADRMGPAELLDYDRERLAGLVLAEQSHLSHVAIVARSLDIPVVGGMKNFLNDIRPGDALLVDGNEGRVYIRPVQGLIRQFDVKAFPKKTGPIEPVLETMAPLSAETRDGVSLSLLLNAGLIEDVDHIEAAGAEGIGLYRTEIPFMMQPKLLNVAEQTKLYREILNRAGNHPVVFRTLDVGGDKMLPYLERLKSEKLITEQRVTRIFFDRPILLRYQLRALIQASVGHELTIMLPMVAEVSEVKAARELLDSEIAREKAKGNPTPAKIRLGAMIEVPALVSQLPSLFPHVHFLSVGSNDLFQFFYAIDRDYPKLSRRYDVLSPTFLSLLKSIQEQCKIANIPLSVCGEMAGRPLEALALIGLGYRSLSMSAAAVPLVKHMIRTLSCQEISAYMADVCTPSHASIREDLRDFARDRGIHCE